MCVATDDCDNTARCEFRVEVRQDVQPPGIVCPTNRLVICTGTNGAQVTFTTETSDDCDTNVMVACTPASGSFFPVGTTTVNCVASDDCGHTNSCSFTVTVTERTVVALSIARQQNTLTICWPADTCLNYVLEETFSLNSPPPFTWTRVDAMVTMSGGRRCVMVPIGSGNRFFRLRSLDN
jgi:hypothetical protein